jgi:predicted kinase
MIADPKYDHEESYFVYEACIQVAKEALKCGYLTILDGTFLREDYRSKAFSSLRPFFAKAFTVEMICSHDTALKRNQRRTDVFPEANFERMWTYFEPPANSIKIDTDSHSIGEAVFSIMKVLNSSDDPVELVKN